MHNQFSKILNDINSILVPRGCFGCNALLHKGERLLCTVCRNQLPLTEYDYNDENPFDRIFYGRIVVKKSNALLFFTENGIVKNLIHHLKYKNQEEIGGFLGDWFGSILKEEGSLKNIDLVVPVPLHRRKRKQRGYNQVTLFGQRLAEHLNATYEENALIKTRNSKTQTRKDRYFRWRTNQDLFELNSTIPLDRRTILLVDDVVTTGATLEACVKALSKAKAVTVYIATMAIVPKA